eukprot:Colp12_sorted_trinity150504_noHs@12876
MTMLPTTQMPPGAMPRSTPVRSNGRYKYFKRIFNFRQMDFEFALWQMLYLCIAPRKFYRNIYYHKQTKNQWARDDPAFLVLLAFWLCASSVAVALVFGLGFADFMKFLLWVVFVDCIGLGCVVATFFWLITNKYMRTQRVHSVEQSVEWQYAFDVHCNSFFPLLIILHLMQLAFIPVLRYDSFVSPLVGNTLYLIAIGYYNYITFLGYSALPFLARTVLFLYPIGLLVLGYILALAFNFNMATFVLHLYGLS